MINRNASWSRSVYNLVSTLSRGDWLIMQASPGEYTLHISGFKPVQGRSGDLAYLQAVTEEFVASECNGSWSKASVPAWIER